MREWDEIVECCEEEKQEEEDDDEQEEGETEEVGAVDRLILIVGKKWWVFWGLKWGFGGFLWGGEIEEEEEGEVVKMVAQREREREK